MNLHQPLQMGPLYYNIFHLFTDKSPPIFMILMYFPFLSVWQMIRLWLNGIGFVTLRLCYIFTI